MDDSIKKIRITAIIQARVDSTRLPSKALLSLAGRPLTQHVVEKAKAIEGVDCVVIATGNNPANRPLEEIAEKSGVEIFYGSEKNVLERYYLAAQKYGGDYIIRITGDNPFTDSCYAALTVKKAVSENADLCAPAGLPLGTSVEVIKHSALVECFNKSSSPYQFEHVTPFIKENPDMFKIVRYRADMPDVADNLRLTIDTPEDYKLAQYIYEKLPPGSTAGIEEILKLYSENPEPFSMNRHVEQRPMTHSE